MITNIGNFLYVCNLQAVTSSMFKISSYNKKTSVWTIMHGTIINNKRYKLDISYYIGNAGFTFIYHLWKLYLAPDNAFLGQVLLPKSLMLISNNDSDIYKE